MIPTEDIDRSEYDIISEPLEGMQMRVLASPCREILMGGQAGPGKTWTLLNMDILDLLEFPDLRVLVLRRETPDMGDLIEKATLFYTPLGATFSAYHKYYKRATFTFPNGSKVILGHCQHEKDKLKYSGFEFQRIRFDELTHFTESIYSFLWSRLRSVNPLVQTNMASSCNPNGIGMLWVKRRWVDKIAAGEIKAFTRNEEGVEIEVPIGTKGSVTRQWIPGIRAENTFVTDEYEANLNQLTLKDYRALKLGVWEWTDLPSQLIHSEWWGQCTSGKIEQLDGLAGKQWTIGADYAHQGDDASVLFAGQGNKITKGNTWAWTKTTFFAAILAKEVNLVGRNNCKLGVDSIGPGVGVADNLEDIYKMTDILNRCVHKDPAFDIEYHGSMKFNNLRSQMWWKLRMDMMNGEIDLSWFVSDECDFEKISELQEELFAHTFEVVNGVLIVIAKKELKKADKLGRSPDNADAVVIWNWVRDREVPIVHDEREAIKHIDGYMENFWDDEEADEDFDARMWV